MKTYLIIFALLFELNAESQNQEVTECAKFKTHYYLSLRDGRYLEAKNYWLQAYQFCSESNELDEKFFKNGRTIYKQIDKTFKSSDTTAKSEISDTLDWLYLKSLNYPHSDSWKQEYTLFLMERKQYDRSNLIDSLSANIYGTNNPPSARFIETYFRWKLILRQKNPEFKKSFNENDILQFYLDLSKLCYKGFSSINHPEYYEKADNNMRELLAHYPAKNQKSLEQITYVHERIYENMEYRIKALEINKELLEINDHQTSDIYLKINQELLELQPTRVGYFNFAQSLYQLKKYNEAITYYQKAISLEGDSLYLDNSLYQIALAQYLNGDFSSAYKSAQKVNGPNKGNALKLMGDCVASTTKSCGDSTFERKSNYWLANDFYIKAISHGVDVSKTKYLENAPSTREIFEEELKVGDQVYLKCWEMKTVIR